MFRNRENMWWAWPKLPNYHSVQFALWFENDPGLARYWQSHWQKPPNPFWDMPHGERLSCLKVEVEFFRVINYRGSMFVKTLSFFHNMARGIWEKSQTKDYCKRNGILLQNCSDLLWEKNCSSDREIFLKILSLQPRISKVFLDH